MKIITSIAVLVAGFLLFTTGVYVGSIRTFHAQWIAEQIFLTNHSVTQLGLLYNGSPADIKESIVQHELIIASNYYNHLQMIEHGFPRQPIRDVFFPSSVKDNDVWNYGKRYYDNMPLFPCNANCPKPASFNEKLIQSLKRHELEKVQPRTPAQPPAPSLYDPS